MKSDYPNIKVAGYLSPPFKDKYNKTETNKMINFINKKKPDVLWVGLTQPKQEKWIYENLDKLDTTSKKIGAVNTIKFTKRGNLKGYNSDVVGFENSIKPLLKKHHNKALILGTGGASKAIAFVLKKNNIKSESTDLKYELSYNYIYRISCF